MTKYPRDMQGYGEQTPKPNWPKAAKIALQFVINYEEGAENNILHGDSGSETFLSEIIGANAYPARHMSMESLYEYGSRAGFWRLHRLFCALDIPVTVYGVAMAMQRNQPAVEAMLKANWEIASHGYRWIDYQFMAKDLEREHMARAIEIHESVTGTKPLGWYTGRDSPTPAIWSSSKAISCTIVIHMPMICPTGMRTHRQSILLSITRQNLI